VALAVAKRLFGRAARASVTVPGDLAERVEALLRERCGALLGLARRAGVAVSGFEKVREAIGSGKTALLVVASDGGESGREKVGALAGDLPLVAVLSAAELGAVFARDRVVHVALARSGIAREVAIAAERVGRYGEPAALEGASVRGRGGGRRRSNEGNGTGTR
jgi:uncharacterized protein